MVKTSIKWNTPKQCCVTLLFYSFLNVCDFLHSYWKHKEQLFVSDVQENHNILACEWDFVFLHMSSVARMLYAQSWKEENILTVEQWILKLLELAEMVKLTALPWDNFTKFLATWKPLLKFLQDKEKCSDPWETGKQTEISGWICNLRFFSQSQNFILLLRTALNILFHTYESSRISMSTFCY